MKKFIKLLSAVLLFSMIFCLNGCGKSESEYKSAISEHMSKKHGISIISYESFSISDNGGAFAKLGVMAPLARGDGNIEVSVKVSVDDECNVSSCPWCD